MNISVRTISLLSLAVSCFGSACAITAESPTGIPAEVPVCTQGDTRVCFPGSPDLVGVGPCRLGRQTCTEQGTWGACAGAILPAEAEDCATIEDDDCDGRVNEVDEGCLCAPGEAEACYSGPQGTREVGACRSGLAMCTADGRSVMACKQERLPQAERCGTSEDEDCDGQPGCSGAVQAAWLLGGTGQRQSITCLAPAPDGGFFLAGEFDGRIELASGVALDNPALGEPNEDAFVARYDVQGGVVWQMQLGGTGRQRALDCDLGQDGQLYVGGVYDGELVVTGMENRLPPPSAEAGFVLAFAANDGIPNLVLHVDTQGSDVVRRVDISTGTLVVAGQFDGTLSGDLADCGVSQGVDVFVARRPESGMWPCYVVQGPGLEGLGDLHVRDSAHVYVGGLTEDGISGCGAVSPDAERHPYLALIEGETFVRSTCRSWDTPGNAEVYAITTSTSGMVFVAGYFKGTATFIPSDPLVVSVPESPNGFLLAMRGDLHSIEWQEQFASGGEVSMSVLTVDAADYVLVGGTFQAATTFFDRRLVPAASPLGANRDVFLAKVDPVSVRELGNRPVEGLVWAKNIGANSTDATLINLRVVQPLASGALWIAGHTNGPISFGGEVLVPQGPGYRGFIARLSP
jgi:hypothetical protein